MHLSRFLPVLILLLPLMTACASASRNDPFIYADSTLSLNVEGIYLPANDSQGSPRPFAATVIMEAPQGENLTLREMSVTFTAPDTLAGVTVISSPSVAPDGSVTRRVEFSYPSDYGNVRTAVTGGELDGFLRLAEAWLPVGDVTEISTQPPDGGYTVTRKDGDRVLVFAFGTGEALPVGVRLTDGRGTVEMRRK